MSEIEILEIPVKGMDCIECTQNVQSAIAGLAGVDSVEVYLASEKAVIHLDPARVDLPSIRKAVEGAGYSVPGASRDSSLPLETDRLKDFTRPIITLLGVVFGIVLFVVIVGELLGFFELTTQYIPWPVSLAFILILGFPVFLKVFRATLRGKIISHTLMTLGVIAAIAVGEWTTAAVVVVFMRIGDYTERFTTERARRAVKDLTALAPQTARIEQDGNEVEIPISQVKPGDIIRIRPGEKIPVDGEVTDGEGTVDQSSITGESLPVEVGPGAHVYAATMIRLGSLRISTTRVGADTTFGHVIRLVEEAEMHKADVQLLADRFSTYYLPVVTVVAALTFLIRKDPLATAAVLVVACSCSFALATPIAMLASIGAGAKRGLLIKGGKYLELLEKADTLLIDKTGTITFGRPQITDVITVDDLFHAESQTLTSHKNPSHDEVLKLAASAEHYSEHPLAEAVRQAAISRGIPLSPPERFENIPGMGVRANIDGIPVAVGNRRMLTTIDHRWAEDASGVAVHQNPNPLLRQAEELEAQGKTILFVARDHSLIGLLAAADTLRPEIPEAIAAISSLGIKDVELLTGDNERTTASLMIGKTSPALNTIRYRANLLPEEKIAIVKEYQSQGHTVIMVGDGINDAPALAQADIGIAMGAAGTDIAIEAAHIALMRDDWRLVPEVLAIARRTMRIVRLNIAFTMVYNLIGLSLAALGYLPPVLAAALQSLPDIGILANSSRLLRQR